MSSEKLPVGAIGWHDLTVEKTPELLAFYQSVIGWTHDELSMGDYSDYVMKDANGTGTAGICHARGENAGIPPQWLIYFIVEDMDRSVAEVKSRGGEVLTLRNMGGNRFAVIRDPAGAVCALYQQESAT